ncbi:MAG: hypothetical protein HKN65_12500, partial [Woeseiaceae bacterium]|nr:hypothetical protein [Woeseiaceae bacterium]
AQSNEVYYDPDDGTARTIGTNPLDDRFDYLRYGPELTYRQGWGAFGAGFRIKAQLWNYEDIEDVPEFDHEYFHIGTHVQYRFTPTSLLRFDAAFSSRHFGDRRGRDLDGSIDIANEELRYDYIDLGVVARQRITRNMWFGIEYERRDRKDQYVGYNNYLRDGYGAEFHWDIGQRFEIEMEGQYRLYSYDNAFAYNNTAAGPKTLETVDGRIRATYRMTRRLSLVLDARHRETESTDARIQYDRRQYVLGVRWEQ